MKKVLITLFLYISILNFAIADISIINTAPSEPFEKKVNTIQKTLMTNIYNQEVIDKYVNALSIRANYYKRVKKNLEKSSDDLRSALFFLSRDRGSDKYDEFSKKLASNLSDMEYFPQNSDSLELAKNLYWEEKYFASAFEFEKLASIGYKEYVCDEFLGDIYQKFNDNQKSINYYTKSLKNYPNNADASYKLAKLYEKMGNFNMADEQYRKTVEIAKERKILDEIITLYEGRVAKNNKNANYYEILALAYKGENNFSKTYELLNKALLISPKDTIIKYELGNVLYEMKDFEKAIEIYNSILTNNLYESQIRIMRARALMNLGRKEEGVKEYQVVLAIYPDNLQAQYGIYRAFWGMPLSKIEKEFYPLNKNFTANSIFYEKLGNFTQNIDETKDSITFFEQAILLDNKNANAYIGLYKDYELLNNNTLALNTIKEAYEVLPENKEIIKLYETINKSDTQRKDEIALSYYKNNEYQKALKVYGQINPKTSSVYLSMANCQMILKQFKEAQENFNNALKIDPTNSDIYYMLALNYLEQNSPQSAKRELNKAISLNKNNIKAQKLLNSILRNEINEVLTVAVNYYDKKDYNNAIKTLNEGLQKFGGYLQLFYYRGTVLEAQNKLVEALADYKKVVDIDNSYDPVYYSLGRLFDKMGRGRDSLSAFERYLSGSPDNKEYIKYAQKRVLELQAKYY